MNCPHCQKEFLWGIYLDIPAEIKTGKAVWVACEPPEPEARVQCPSCSQDAGGYADLYSASAESRRMAKLQKRAELLQAITPAPLARLTLLGCAFRGNAQREAFLKDCWESVFEWLQTLKKEHVFPRQSLPEGAPVACGVFRADGEYFAGIPLWVDVPEKLLHRLHNPEYSDPKDVGILTVEEGLYGQFRFEGGMEEYAVIPKLLQKDWLPNAPFQARPSAALELYWNLPHPWPPSEHKPLQITYALPIEPKALVEETSTAVG